MFMPFIYRVHIEDSVLSLVVMKYCKHAAYIDQDPMYLYNNVYMCVCISDLPNFCYKIIVHTKLMLNIFNIFE